VFNDLRYALRLTRKRPTATAVAVITLAIGVGANTAIFGIIRAVLLKPLPYADAKRLVLLAERWPMLPGPRPMSRLNYRDWAAQNTVFERIAAVTWGEATMSGGYEPVQVAGSLVSPAYFDVFGLHAALGRTFAPDEDQPGRDHVVVLSHRLWTSQFGTDPAVVGTPIRLDGETYTIIGVMPVGASVEFGFASGTAYNAHLDQLASRVQSLPAIRDVAFADSLPTEGSPFGKLFQVVGQLVVPYAARPLCGFKVVSPSYFSAVGLRLIEGRVLSDRDRDDAPLVVVINQAMARSYFRGVDPVGQRMLMRRNPIRGPAGTVDLDWTIVGVVADESVSPFGDRTAQPGVYVTREQYPRLDLAVVVRTTVHPTRVSDSLRRTISEVDPTQAITDIKAATQLEADDLSSDRLRSILLSAFAGIAVVIATLGLYGVIAYVVVQRTREIAIRAALGANAASLLGLVMRQGTAMIGWGLGAGLVISLVVTRLLKTFLFGVGPSDPRTMIVVAGVLSGVALAACYVPARRATGVDPIIVLKAE
jgi:hypothetical protein